MSERLLLDTCAVIWAAQDDSLADLASEAIDDAWQRGEALRVSPISAWEIGLLVARGRLRLSRAPLNWFEDFVATARAEVVPLTPSIMVASSFLPDSVHGDPADRILIATARENGLAIVTRDRAILDYAREGHVAAVEC